MPSATPPHLSVAATQFLAARHLASFTSLRPDGTPHVTPVGFTWDGDAGLARVITSRTSRKARNVAAAVGSAQVALCQLEGRRWLSLEGSARVTDDPVEVADAEARYALRYRVPRVNPARVAIVVAVRRVLGSADFFL